MAFIKHVGKQGDRKVCILFRQVPGEDHMALVIYPEVLPAHWQDSSQQALESDIAQQSEELADALHRAFLPDGNQKITKLELIIYWKDVLILPNSITRVIKYVNSK